jgi:uncharacterized protein YaiI (UPF0178 family)
MTELAEKYYFARIWVVDGVVTNMNTNTHPIQHDVVEVENATRYDMVIEGDYVFASELMPKTTINNDTISIEGYNILAQEKIDG